MRKMSRHRVLAWERRNVAVHEAGHIVIGRILGVTYIDGHIFQRIDALPIERTWGGATEYSQHYLEFPAPEQPRTRQVTKSMKRMIAVAGAVAELCWRREDVDVFSWEDPEMMSPTDWQAAHCEPGQPDDLCAKAILKVGEIFDPFTGEGWRELCLTARELIEEAREHNGHSAH